MLDPALRRALKLGPHDLALVTALQRPRTIGQLLDLDPDARTRLTALARLYLLAGPRSDARIALDQPPLPPAQADAPLHWPPGRSPPQHGCVGTGTCCSASFLGPVHPRDVERVQSLSYGRTTRVQLGQTKLETVQFRGQTLFGMAREASGACVVQGDDGLCEIHAEHGLHAKPVTCRQFPLRLHQSPDGVHVSLLLACDGYHRARPAAQPWPDREPELRRLLHDGAVPVRVALPVTLAAGLPVAWSVWQALRAQCFADEPATPDALLWLDRLQIRVAGAITARQHELAEGPDVTWPVSLQPRTLSFTPQERATCAGLLRQRATALPYPRDRDRLEWLAQGLEALADPLPCDPDAQLHLHDIVANDLAVHVVLGELDAGLVQVALRVHLARAIAGCQARSRGLAVVDGQSTTHALHVVYRSEAELTWLESLPHLQVAPMGPVP